MTFIDRKKILPILKFSLFIILFLTGCYFDEGIDDSFTFQKLYNVQENRIKRIITGKLETPDGTPMANMRVTAVNEETSFQYTTVTNEDGEYRITRVKTGTYIIKPKNLRYSFIPEQRIEKIKIQSDTNEYQNKVIKPKGVANADFIVIKDQISTQPRVVLPDGYNADAIDVKVSPVEYSTRINFHYVPIGNSYDITLAENLHTDFGDEYAELHFSYNEQNLMREGLNVEFLVFYFDEVDEVWKKVDRTLIDHKNSKVIAYTSHFSTFVLTAIPSATGTIAEPPACIDADYPTGIGGSGDAAFTIIDQNFKYYQDRNYFILPWDDPTHINYSARNAITFKALGLDGSLGISTWNSSPEHPGADHRLYTGKDYIVFTAHIDMDIYVMYDTRGGLDINNYNEDAGWLTAKGFSSDIGGQKYFIETSDSSGWPYAVYKKSYRAGEQVQLHGNLRRALQPSNLQLNYWVVIKKLNDTTSGNPSDLCTAEPDTTAPAKVTNLKAVPGENSVLLSWQNPDVQDFAGVVIRRGENSPPMSIYEGDEPTGSKISPQSFRDEGLDVGDGYFYSVFSLDKNNNYILGGSIFVFTSVDSDGDGLSDQYEINIGTDPNNIDTDGDGVSDGNEVENGSNPNNSDEENPTITDFTLTSKTPTNNRNVTFTLDGTDNVGITQWLVTETAAQPNSNSSNWSSTKPTGYTLPDEYGNYTIYAWAKDNAGNVNSEPTLKITVDYVSENVWEGDYRISDESDILALKGYTKISGGLYIVDTNLRSLKGLEKITSVEGILYIKNNTDLTSLYGLNNLDSVGRNLYVEENASLTDLSGLDNITSVEGELYITKNVVLENLSGLDNLTSVGGKVTINNNDEMRNINGLNNLNYIGEALRIFNNTALKNISALGSLATLNGTLSIVNNASLASLSGLGNITSVSRYLSISDNTILPTCEVDKFLEQLVGFTGTINIRGNDDNGKCPWIWEGDYRISDTSDILALDGYTKINGSLYIENTNLSNLDGLENITSVGGILYIRKNTALANLNGLNNLTSIGEDLYIGYNSALTGLSGLKNLTSVGGNLNIIRNKVLPACEADQLPEQLIDFRGTARIGGNDNNGNCPWVWEDEYIVSDAGDILALEGYTKIKGNLLIHNTNLVNLDGLKNITSVGGDLSIGHNPDLTNIDGLSNLSYVGGILNIDDNNEIRNINGLSNLTYVGGRTFIVYNAALTNIDGLRNLTWTPVAGDLEIGNNPLLTNLNGLSNMTSIGGFLVIENNAVLTNLDGLNNLAYVGEYVSIRGNSSLANLNGLHNLLTIEGLFKYNYEYYVHFEDNMNLSNDIEKAFIDRFGLHSYLDGISYY